MCMEELIINISGCIGGISSTVASVRQFAGLTVVGLMAADTA